MKWMMYVALISASMAQALAWGPQGHKIVGVIAEARLTPKAKRAAQTLLEGQSLADVSNWADSIKGQREWTHTKPWHYVDIADGETYESSPHSHDGDVISATQQMITVLKNRSASQVDKQNALKFIVHFMGDIHQPLHVGRPDDQGGNSVRIRFEGTNTNLHQLWDSGMINQQGMDYQQYAEYLETLDKLSPAATAFPYEAIVEESLGAREDIYDFNPLAPSTVVLTRRYMERNVALMNARLLTGGKRLASLLNDIFK